MRYKKYGIQKAELLFNCPFVYGRVGFMNEQVKAILTVLA